MDNACVFHLPFPVVRPWLANKPLAQTGKLRIIGGQWRGRRLPITEHPNLRPTPDRVRETLFNWLAPVIDGARCLDLFAGTGALGIEALSRGAAHTTFVEHDRRLADAIREHLTTLACEQAQVLCAEGVNALAGGLNGGFDIVFLDPPFAGGLFEPILENLQPLLNPGHRVYLEYPVSAPPTLPASWRTLRDKHAGQVGYCLATGPAAGQDAEHEQ